MAVALPLEFRHSFERGNEVGDDNRHECDAVCLLIDEILQLVVRLVQSLSLIEFPRGEEIIESGPCREGYQRRARVITPLQYT